MRQEPVPAPDESNLIEQVECALAGAIFAVGISVAVLISNFGQEFRALTEAKAQVKLHQDILREHRLLLVQNETVLREHQALLAAHRARVSSSK
jgi:ribosomal protein S4E